MQNEINDKIYRDFDLQFIAHPNTGDVPMLMNHKAIMRSVKNLVLSNIYDHFYNVSIFSGVLDALFENFDPITVKQLQTAVENVVKYNEPRAEYIDTKVSSEELLDKNIITMKIYVRPLNALTPLEIPLVLERLR